MNHHQEIKQSVETDSQKVEIIKEKLYNDKCNKDQTKNTCIAWIINE